MNKIRLEKIYSSGDSIHVKLLINEKDSGVLYLKQNEAELLIQSLRQGVRETDSELESNIFDEDDDFDVDVDE